MGGGDLIRSGSGVVKDEYAASDADDQLAVCARICHCLLGAAHSGQALGLLAGDCVAARVQSDERALINGGTALHRHRDDLCAVGDLRGISHISQFCHDLSPPSYRTS